MKYDARVSRQYEPLLGSHRQVRVVIVAALVFVAGWLRLTAISFGLPEQYRPDENVLVVESLDFEKDWNPHFAIYPAAQFYFLHAVLRSYAAVAGGGGNLHAFYDGDHQKLAFLIARQVSAAMGTATIAALYLAAEPAFGPTAALVSAAIVAVSAIHVRESKFAKMQVPSGLWLALAIGMILRVARRGRGLDYGLAGFFAGLATATYYQAVSVVFGVLAAHLEARRHENRPLLTALVDRRIYLAGCVTLLTFFCATPYVVLNPAQAVGVYRLSQAFGSAAARGWWFLLFRVMPDTFGIGLLIFLLLAVVWVIFHPRPGTPALLGLTAATFLSLTVGHPAIMYRYAINPLLELALIGGIFAADMIGFASIRLGTKPGISLAAAALTLILAPSFFRDLQVNQLLLRTDTRTLAERWIVEHIPRGSAIAARGWANPWGFRGMFGLPQFLPGYTILPVQLRLSRSDRTLIVRDLHSLRASGISWVLSDSFPSLPLYSPGPSNEELAALSSEATLMFDVNPMIEGAPTPVFDLNDAFYVPFQHITSMERPGPRIRIWKLKPE